MSHFVEGYLENLSNAELILLIRRLPHPDHEHLNYCLTDSPGIISDRNEREAELITEASRRMNEGTN